MPFEITMPQLGLTMEKGSVVEWFVKEGDQITPGQEIFDVETDKAVVAVEAHHAGTITRILVSPGQQVPVGTVLAVGVGPGESLPADWQPSQPAIATMPKPELVRQSPQTLPTPSQIDPLQASWKAREMARRAGLDLATVNGSGPNGRIIAKDVVRTLSVQALAPPVAVKATPVATRLAATLGLDLSGLTGSGPQEQITQADVLQSAAAIIRQAPDAAPKPGLPQVASTVPLQGVRKIVSEGMATSAHATARVTLLQEVDVTELVKLRERFKGQGLEVSYNDILIRICALALREHPGANARLGNNGHPSDGWIEWMDRVNIGLAVDTERGLLVPVIRSADRLSIVQTAAERARLVKAARAGRSLPDDLTGGTFTITNLGMFGVEGFTPIINLPECCILGVGRIVRKPTVIDEDDTVVVRPMMTLSLVFDHRVIDGAPAARFLDRIAQLVQDPLLLLTNET